MKLLAVADLCHRWQYTRAGIHKMMKLEEFPKPMAMVALGRTAIFSEDDILAYEDLRQELLKNPNIKTEKVKNPTSKNKDWVSDFGDF